MSPDALRAELRAILGENEIAADPAPYQTDQRRRYFSPDTVVALPASVAAVQALVRFCRERGITLTPQGGNTGLVGGSCADGGVILNLSRINRIRHIDLADNAVTVEAGCVLDTLRAAVRDAGRFFPLSLASGGSCQIGGNIACNAGGLNVLRYGTMRNLVLGLEVVLPDGSLVSQLAPLHKNTTGYDLKQLFIGREGTLGVITAATLKLFALPQSDATAWVGTAGIDDAVRLLALVRDRFGERLSSFELVSRYALELSASFSSLKAPADADWHVLIELTDSLPQQDLGALLAEVLLENGFDNAVLALSEQERRELWTLRENISAAQRSLGASIKHDIALPIARVPEFADACGRELAARFAGIKIVLFGHLGDGSLHYNTFLPGHLDNSVYEAEAAVNETVYRHVLALDGTIAAEHGIGSLKKHWLPQVRSAEEMALMRAVKQHLDPQNLFNPGKIFI